MMDMPRTFYPAEGQHLSKEVCSPEGTTVSTGQKEPRDSRQVLEDVQHQQGHVLGWGGGVGGWCPGQQHPKDKGFCLSSHCMSLGPSADRAYGGH